MSSSWMRPGTICTVRMIDVWVGGEKLSLEMARYQRDVVGINDSHFTVVPILDMNGHMVMLVVIFKAKKLPISWCLGV